MTSPNLPGPPEAKTTVRPRAAEITSLTLVRASGRREYFALTGTAQPLHRLSAEQHNHRLDVAKKQPRHFFTKDGPLFMPDKSAPAIGAVIGARRTIVTDA